MNTKSKVSLSAMANGKELKELSEIRSLRYREADNVIKCFIVYYLIIVYVTGTSNHEANEAVLSGPRRF